jgi:5-oxoprolinase (ATP-hydrolysing) subunit C
MSGALRAIVPGPYVTLQDAGRRGWRRFGVSGSGAMDLPALTAANALVGNPPNTAALEFAHVGGTWEVDAETCRIAVTGGNFAVAVDNITVEPWQSHTLRRGQRLWIKGAPDAVWGYLAVAQGFEVTPQLGSFSTHLHFGLGGIGGRRVEEGDVLPLRAIEASDGLERRVSPPFRAPGPVRVVLGPQDDFFTPETIAAFLASPYRVTHRGDRMGVWLEGPPIAHADGYNLVSDGLVPGSIQVPGAGQPVVLLMDCQTTGGYPKLATIIGADLPRMAQSRPGTLLTFAAIDVDTAQRLYRTHRSTLADIGLTTQEVAEPPPRAFWLRA